MRELALSNCRIDKRYDVRDRLGQGSYAEIFVARDILASTQSPHSTIVIKALNVFLQEDIDLDLERTLVENFQNEAAALDRVRHPNIISRLGHGTARDLEGTIFHYLVLEYLSGGDLQSVIRRREVPIDQALSYIEQVCAGLGHAHSRGIIHRDIKPQNLLLTGDQVTVKIADFGVARSSAADSPITRVGTNIYAPPEHSPAYSSGEFDTDRLTPSADIYSLAKTVYTIITREAPRSFTGSAITSLPDNYRDEEWSDHLVAALRRATDDDPARRPQSVEEFWFDLSPVLSIIADAETSTVIRPAVQMPQPHVSRGYTPLVPEQPSFEAVLEERPAAVPDGSAFPRSTAVEEYPAIAPTHPPQIISPPLDADAIRPAVTLLPQKKKGRKLRRLMIFVIFAVVFTSVLYGTANYFRNAGLISTIRNTVAPKVAVANTDIYLRPAPNTDNDPIGLVTKNSKVRIVDTRDNWYQVDVVEQGRVRTGGPNSTHGWLNGKYVDISEN